MSSDKAASDLKRHRSTEDVAASEFKQIKRQQKKQKKSHAAALTTSKPTMSFDLNQINKRNHRYAIHVSLYTADVPRYLIRV